MYCSHCGTKNQDNAQHCSNCGYKLIHNAEPLMSLREDIHWIIVLPAIFILVILLKSSNYLNLEYGLALLILSTIIVLTAVGYFSKNIKYGDLNAAIVGAISFIAWCFISTGITLDNFMLFFLLGSISGKILGYFGIFIKKRRNKLTKI